MGYPRHHNTRQSGVDWIGKLPAHWELSKLRMTSYIKGRIGWQGLRADEFIDEGPYLITGMHFKDGKVNWDVCYHITEDRYMQAPEIQVKERDILITKDGTIGKVAYIDYLPGPASLNSHLLLVRPTNNAYLPKFLYWYLQSDVFNHYVQLTQTGTTFFGITQEKVEQFIFAVPSASEQYGIVSFLDRKTAEIDALIAKKERQIELLLEKRQITIKQAVTRGLSPDATTKDSGVEWIGEIPEHWTVTPLSGILDYISYGFTNPMPVADEGPYLLTANDIGDGVIKYDTARRTEEIAFRKLLTNKSRPKHGDVLVTKDGTLGRTAVFDGSMACINQSVALLRPRDTLILSDFLYYLLTSNGYQNKILLDAGGTTIKHIYITKLCKMLVAMPSLNEQTDIVDFLEEKLSVIAKVISRVQKSIKLLREYRMTIISNAVTGKIDLRKEDCDDAG